MVRPARQRAQVLLVGALLVPGRRTVASVLRVMGLDGPPRGGERRFKNYHRVLSRARWSALAGSRLLLLALVERFVPEGPVVIGIDDTIERRWGRGSVRAASTARRTVLIADRLQCHHPLPVQRSAWYTKPPPTFADALAAVRQTLWHAPGFCTSPSEAETVEIPKALLERWTEAIRYAA